MARKRTKSPPFVMLPRWVVRSPAWRGLSPNARAVYLELRDRFNGHNNGFIGLGCREAGEAINVGRNIANRAIKELKEGGFIEATAKGAFRQNGRRATDWLLTELPDDRTGHSALKTFMSTGGRKKLSPAHGTVSPAHGTQQAKRKASDALRPAHGTISGNIVELASRQRDTSRSTIPPVPKLRAVQLAEEAPVHTGRARRSEQTADVAPDFSARSDKTIHVSDTLRGLMGIPRPASTPLVLSDDERTFLRWLNGFNGTATHRTAQQNLSGQLKGDGIVEGGKSLAEKGLLKIQQTGRSRVYVLTEAGRDPSLLHDPDQFDLVNWLAEAAQ